MLIDLLILGIVALMGIFGFSTGIIKQLHYWLGIVFAHLVSKPLALILTLMLAPDLGMPPIQARIGLSVLCFLTFYVIGSMIAGFFIKKIAKGREKGRIDRAVGVALATGKGSVILFVTLSGLVAFERPLSGIGLWPAESAQRSLILSALRRRSPVDTVSALSRIETLMDAAKRTSHSQEDPELKKLLRDPELSQALQDERLIRAVKSGNWSVLSEDPRIAELLRDPRIVGPLTDPLDYAGVED